MWFIQRTKDTLTHSDIRSYGGGKKKISNQRLGYNTNQTTSTPSTLRNQPKRKKTYEEKALPYLIRAIKDISFKKYYDIAKRTFSKGTPDQQTLHARNLIVNALQDSLRGKLNEYDLDAMSLVVFKYLTKLDPDLSNESLIKDELITAIKTSTYGW